MIKKYNQFINDKSNEGLRSTLATAGLVGSLLTSPSINADTNNKLSKSVEMNSDTELNKQKSLRSLGEISNIRKSEKVKDTKLASILSEIESNVNSGDSAKFVEIYNKLSSHIEDKYGYKIKNDKVEDKFVEAGVAGIVGNMTFFEIMGWLGSICLAICGLPQAWQSYKDKNSDGISWGFILLWAFGEVFALAYVYDKLDLPLVLNYSTNILILGVILYFKIKPKNNYQEDVKEI